MSDPFTEEDRTDKLRSYARDMLNEEERRLIHVETLSDLLREAASHIDHLEAALREIAEDTDHPSWRKAKATARAALSGGNNE